MEDPAIARFKEMLAKDPRSMAFAPLAEAYRKSGRLEEAISVSEAGLKAHPGYLGGLVVLGRALFDKGEIPRSFEILAKVVRENPDNYMAAKTLARIHAVRGEVLLARAAFLTVRSLMPGDREVEEELVKLGPLVAAAEAEEAAKAGERAAREAEEAARAAEEAARLAAEEAARNPPPPPAPALPRNPFDPDGDDRAQLGDIGSLSGEEPEADPGPPISFIEETPFVPSTSLAGNIGGSDDHYGIVVEETAGAGEPAALATETLARLYSQQGAEEEARRVLAQMGKETGSGESGPSGTPEAVRALQGWLAGVERMRKR